MKYSATIAAFPRLPALFFPLLLALTALPSLRSAPPNIVFVITDQWRAQAFGYAGDPNVHTPNIDRFESQATNFRHAVSGVSVCTPARASLLTGQRPLTHGLFLNDLSLNPDIVTLAEVLDKAGYAAGCIGKWHVNGNGRSNYIPPERRQGFNDYWRVLECTHNYNHSFYYADGPEKLTWPGYDAILQTEDACAYLETRKNSRQPFLLWLSLGPPHAPYQTAPQAYRDRFKPAEMVLRPNVPPEKEAKTRENLAGYYAHTAALDDCFGRILDTLKTTGLAENTIVVFTSDHGDMLGSHGLEKKQQPYDESIRVPMLMRLPSSLGIAPGRVDAPINSEDVMPTLLGLCDIPIPSTVEGLNFVPYLRGGKDPSGAAAVISCPAPFGQFERRVGGREYRGLRTDRYTYTRDLDGPWLLFDNQTDPYQMHNLINSPELADLQTRLDAELQRRLDAQHDAFLPAADYIAKWGYKVDANGTIPYKN